MALKKKKSYAMAKGKKKFPDLNKDGKITKADILMGRGVKNMSIAVKDKPALWARKKAEAEARDAQISRQREQRGYESEADPTPKYELRYVEINSASVAELTHVCNIKNGTAEDIVKERERNGQFGDWVDVVHRVFAMSAAQNVVYASVCGLTVNGQSFNGAPADEAVAQQIYQRYSHYK